MLLPPDHRVPVDLELSLCGTAPRLSVVCTDFTRRRGVLETDCMCTLHLHCPAVPKARETECTSPAQVGSQTAGTRLTSGYDGNTAQRVRQPEFRQQRESLTDEGQSSIFQREAQAR